MTPVSRTLNVMAYKARSTERSINGHLTSFAAGSGTRRFGKIFFIIFYKLCHNTKKTLQIVTGNHNSFWPITVIPK